jgi:hypothetical protein
MQRLENGLLSITAHGVDTVIAQDKLSLRRDRLIANRSVPESDLSNSQEFELELTRRLLTGAKDFLVGSSEFFVFTFHPVVSNYCIWDPKYPS